MRKAAAARLAETLVLPLRRLPPETFVPGLRASQEAKCFSLGQALMSVPVSESTASTVRSEEHTSELQSLMRISYAVFCLKKTKLIFPIITQYHNIKITF